MTERHDHTAPVSRREALRLLGAGAAGAGLGLAAACAPAATPEPSNGTTQPAAIEPTAPSVAFPAGAIVRTLLADVDPDALGTGATLFHEHLAFDFASPPAEPRAPGTPEPPRPTNAAMVDLLVDELRMAAFDGVSCIVDSSIGPAHRPAARQPDGDGDPVGCPCGPRRQLLSAAAVSGGDHPDV